MIEYMISLMFVLNSIEMLNNSSLEDIDDVDVTCLEKSIEQHHICRESKSFFI